MVTAPRLSWAGPDGWCASACPPPERAVLVDSFLAVDGRVRDLGDHEERFRGGCAALGLPTAGLRSFLEAARTVLPREGRWFPRFEAHADGGLVIWLREAPAPGREIRLRVHPGPDPRRHPRLKGPDLAVLAELRRQAVEHGADDAVLTGPGGVVLEAAHSGLLWWHGDRLHVPDPDLPILPSVTVGRLLRVARAESVDVTPRRCTPEALAGAEVWAVNALHGIRPVTGWRGGGPTDPVADPDRTRLERFRGHLAAPAAPAAAHPR